MQRRCIESFSKLGIDLSLVAPVLVEWCNRKDQAAKMQSIYRKKPENKKRRAEAINAMIKASSVQDRRATRVGQTYATGIAVAPVAQLDVEDGGGNSNLEAVDEESTIFVSSPGDVDASSAEEEIGQSGLDSDEIVFQVREL